MAKIKQGILGGFSGKVANVVGTSWKGRAVMKSQPLSVANPKTEAQQEQRGKFSKVAELASAVLTQFVQPVENPISGDISGYNLFCKDNKSAFDAAGNIVVANFVCGGGKIVNLPVSSLSVDEDAPDLQLKWVNGAEATPLRKTDKVYAVAVKESTGEIWVSAAPATRNDQLASLVNLSPDSTIAANDKFAVIYACVSADGRDVSIKTVASELTYTE